MKIDGMRDMTTGQIGPAHLNGTDEDGRAVYQAIDGWEPVTATDDGQFEDEGARFNLIPPENLECDQDGNYHQ